MHTISSTSWAPTLIKSLSTIYASLIRRPLKSLVQTPLKRSSLRSLHPILFLLSNRHPLKCVVRTPLTRSPLRPLHPLLYLPPPKCLVPFTRPPLRHFPPEKLHALNGCLELQCAGNEIWTEIDGCAPTPAKILWTHRAERSTQHLIENIRSNGHVFATL
jgi:hypothetical protein